MLHRDYARQLRLRPSKAQVALWYYLRSKQIKDSKFRREHPIGPYIVDFICLKKKLIIELDGGQHASQTGYDKQRAQWFESQGFTVLRFWNNEVLVNMEGVLQVIETYL